MSKVQTYLAPEVTVVDTDLWLLSAASDSITSDKGISYGGVDDEGQKDPASRKHDVWDDEEEVDNWGQ